MSSIVRIARALVLVIPIAALSACRLIYIVPQGGELRNVFIDDALECDEQSVCDVSVTEPNYAQFVTAVAHAGWEFAGWREQTGFLFFCGPGKGSLAGAVETCVLDNTVFAGNPGAEAAIAGDALKVYVSPIFVPQESGVSYTDTINVAGKEWAQPADFVGLSWDGINAVCPGGICGPGAILRGYDMAGWTWASLEDVNALANHYLAGEYTMGPGPDDYGDAASAVSAMLPISGGSGGPWTPTPRIFPEGPIPLVGLTATEVPTDNTRAYQPGFFLGLVFPADLVGSISTSRTVAKDENDLEHGAFFYHLP